jgi:hypothetical protein
LWLEVSGDNHSPFSKQRLPLVTAAPASTVSKTEKLAVHRLSWTVITAGCMTRKMPEAVAEARRLGGLRRRRKGSVQLAYGFNGLAAIHDLRRLLEIVAVDTLSRDNGVPRNRTVVALVMAGAKTAGGRGAGRSPRRGRSGSRSPGPGARPLRGRRQAGRRPGSGQMTGVNDRRLKRVEEALYPTEAMALWLHEVKQERRSRRPVRSFDSPDRRRPEPEGASKATRRSLPG